MFHVQPIDWEVIASHSIAPVQVIYETDDLRIRSLAPHEVQGSYTFDLHRQNPYPTPAASPAKLHKRLPSAATHPPTTPIPTTSSTLTSSSSSSSRKQITNPFDMLCPSSSSSGAQQQQQKEKEKEGSPVASTSAPSRSWSFKRIINTRRKSTDSTSSSGSSQGYSSIGSASSKLTTPQAELEEVPTATTTSKRHSSPSSLPHTSTAAAAEEKKPQFFTKSDVKKALKFARAQLKAEIAKSSGGKYNSMVVEGWDLTVSHNQQLSKYRIQINYHARPATLVSLNQQQEQPRQEGQQQPSAGWLEVKKEPPYLAILEQL